MCDDVRTCSWIACMNYLNVTSSIFFSILIFFVKSLSHDFFVLSTCVSIRQTEIEKCIERGCKVAIFSDVITLSLLKSVLVWKKNRCLFNLDKCTYHLNSFIFWMQRLSAPCGLYRAPPFCTFIDKGTLWLSKQTIHIFCLHLQRSMTKVFDVFLVHKK